MMIRTCVDVKKLSAWTKKSWTSSTMGEVVLWFFVLCCVFAIPAIVLWWCWLYFIGSRRVFRMVSDGFQAQMRGSWIPGKE